MERGDGGRGWWGTPARCTPSNGQQRWDPRLRPSSAGGSEWCFFSPVLVCVSVCVHICMKFNQDVSAGAALRMCVSLCRLLEMGLWLRFLRTVIAPMLARVQAPGDEHQRGQGAVFSLIKKISCTKKIPLPSPLV